MFTLKAAIENQPQNPELGGCSQRRSRKRRHQRLLTSLLLDFAKNTTLHGLRYITEKGLTIVEKVFWIVTFFASLIICLFLINKVWVKWKTSPVIVTLSEHLISVGEVPFPAVTICPQAKIYQRYYNYTEAVIEFKKTESTWREIKNDTPFIYDTLIDENPAFKELGDVDVLCDESSLFDGGDILKFKAPNFSDHTLPRNIMKAAPKLSDVFLGCVWRSQKVKCLKIFDPVLTSEGVCFTFNTLAADDILTQENIQQEYAYLNTSSPREGWSLEDGYYNNTQQTFPRRGRGNGAEADLAVYFREYQSKQDVLCNTLKDGYKIFLSHPADMPQATMYYYAALPGQLSSFALKLTVLDTSRTLVSYSPQTRQCYFPGEFKLKYFRVYTPNNCRLECLSDFTFVRCGCVAFYMIHNDSTVICSWGKYICVTEAIEEFATQESLGNKYNQYQCLPSCTNIQYDAEILKTSYDVNKYFKVDNKVSKEIHGQKERKKDRFWSDFIKDSKYSKIEMYFKESRYVSMRRSELFGLTEFLANCGGLLGLFLGFSFLSLVEIFYFCTLRFSCLLRKFPKEEEPEKFQ